ncbi:MAG: hypothetical protein IJ438_02975 [Clostridia bacterium]|nr:hypothetical protein [Clostridia bacterium]
MTASNSPFSPQETGARLALLRRAKGLSPLTFAQRINQPLWLAEVMEHAPADLYSCLTPGQISGFLHAVADAFGVSTAWLTTGQPDQVLPCPPSGADDETTFFLPVTISPQSMMDALDHLLLLVTPDASRADERAESILWCVKTLFSLSGLSAGLEEIEALLMARMAENK